MQPVCRTSASEQSSGPPLLLAIQVEDCKLRHQLIDVLTTVPNLSIQQANSTDDIASISEAAAVVMGLSSREPCVSELRTIRALKARSAYVVCLVEEGDSGLHTRCQLLLAGAASVVPLHSDRCLSEVRELIAGAAEKVLNANVDKKEIEAIMARAGFAGRSEASFSLFRSVRRVSALTDLPVLVTGETGSGKELVAIAIHSLDSKRSREPFVTVNCAALPQHLSESELFGHSRGAFTGADRERRGLFRSADRGVLFLDEIGELSHDLQAKLLRVLQTGRLRSVGTDYEIPINVRVVAATNRCLERMMREGSFREDLFHRLNAVTLHIPPLRERRDDIEPALLHFVEKHRVLWQEKTRPKIASEFLQALQNAALTGNARQLENIVCRALIEWEGTGTLSLRHLPAYILEELSQLTPAQVSNSAEEAQRNHPPLEIQGIEYLEQHDWNLSQAIQNLETALVRGAVIASGGNQSEAARLLGITPRSVYNKLHRLSQL